MASASLSDESPSDAKSLLFQPNKVFVKLPILARVAKTTMMAAAIEPRGLTTPNNSEREIARLAGGSAPFNPLILFSCDK